eukprot:m.1365440 g.1365440  ORF g.1365440 m.1365440 type:complete len:566 (+) comp24947_c1_seq4:375-2072(+)
MATENATVIMDTNVGQPATPIEGAVRVQAVITGTEEESEKDLGSSVTHTESDVGEVPHTSSTEPSNDATVSERLSTTTNVLSKQTPAASIAEIPAPPPAVPAPPRKSSFTDVSQHTRKKLQELLKHQLIVPGPDQLTVDLCGMRFFANIDERGIVTTQDHPVPFKDLNELCIYCSGDKSIHYSNNHDGGDSAGWLLVRHKNRPLVTLMSTLANRKAQLKQSTATRVHFSIFDEVPIVRGTRERKRVEKFTYEPRVTKRGRSGVENGDTSAAGTDTSAPGKGKRPVGRPPKGGHPKVGAKQSTPALNVEEGAESDAEEDSEEDSEDADSDAEEDSEDDDDAENSDNNDDGHEVLTARASTGETFEERRRKGSNKKIFFSDDVPECDTGSNKTNPVWCIPCKRSLAGRSSFRRHLKDFHHMTSLKAKKVCGVVTYLCVYIAFSTCREPHPTCSPLVKGFSDNAWPLSPVLHMRCPPLPLHLWHHPLTLVAGTVRSPCIFCVRVTDLPTATSGCQSEVRDVCRPLHARCSKQCSVCACENVCGCSSKSCRNLKQFLVLRCRNQNVFVT